MKKTVLILAAASVMLSAPVFANNYEAGKTKSASCAACHGVDGNSPISAFPTLAGQHADYLYHSLKDYKSGKRANPIMAEQVKSLSDADMRDLATYFAKQKGLKLKY